MDKLLLNIALLFALTSCGAIYGSSDGHHGAFTPHTLFLAMPDEGENGENEDYYKGYRDGCNVGMGLGGVGMLRSHGFEYNPAAALSNNEYYKGYMMGQTACLFYVDWNPL